MTIPMSIWLRSRWAKVRPDVPGRLWSTRTSSILSFANISFASSAERAQVGSQPSASMRSEMSSAISGSSSTIRMRTF
ncbi:hypothetical protein D3C86_1794600 [compost metagenome]